MYKLFTLSALSLFFGFVLADCEAETKHEISFSEEDTEWRFPIPQIPFDPNHYIVYRTDEPIVVDGKINEVIWEKTAWSENFVDIEGDLQPIPRYRTRVKMLWDDDYFYFAAELEEPDIWATLTERNSVMYHENNFEIFIDPSGDTHNYWEFEMNAIETFWDLFLNRPYRDGAYYLNNWNMLDLKVGVHVDGDVNNPRSADNGWTLEVAFTWDALTETVPGRRMPEPGDQWRVNFSRVQYHLDVFDNEYRKRVDPETGEPLPEDNWVWSPQGLINMHYPEMWGYVQFSGKVAGRGVDEFVWNRDEEIKWALRRVYYKQKNYHRKHGYFTDKPEKLGLDRIRVNGLDFDPEIRTTMTMFEAAFPGFDEEVNWYIRHDGKILSR